MSTLQKRNGVHFTPPDLAAVVAERLVPHIERMRGHVRILDPACGDGNLLVAIAQTLKPSATRHTTLVGVEDDSGSFAAARCRLDGFRGLATDLIRGDFLEFVDEASLFSPTKSMPLVDAIIANPPYVRTQVLGAERAQDLAARFQLRGRVDLYQAFLVAMTRQLRPSGVLGVITSNRFLTTRGGSSIREFLRSRYEILEIVDLGDTKLFEAAVLPALVFARKRQRDEAPSKTVAAKFVRIYESAHGVRDEFKQASSVLDLVRRPATGSFVIRDVAYDVAAGSLDTGDDDSRPWTLLTSNENAWVDQVKAQASCRIADVAKIRVGIKTTADSVFIRDDWQCLPEEIRPEAGLLKQVLSHDDAARWGRKTTSFGSRKVLYTHEVANGKRRAIPFDRRSTAWRYLVANRERLESRRYVIEAGRQWYEIWVPQDPDGWLVPKIVFPDISPEPRFFLDRGGSVVDGNCYWITTHDTADEDLLLLILGVANSSVLERFHELAFPNKLYSQRRRYLTQYVGEYPLPPRNSREAKRIVRLVRSVTKEDIAPCKKASIQAEIDALTASAFGVTLKACANAD
jgi:adenine-specific DNA-methyltransferase